MESKIITANNYNIHTLKTDRYKTSQIEFVFRTPVKKENLALNTLLTSMLCDSSAQYPDLRKFAIKLEDLYDINFRCASKKIGNVLSTVINTSFVNPEYIPEKSYLEDLIKFVCNTILYPNIENECFNPEIFSVKKENLLIDIAAIEESPDKLAINMALNAMDSNSVSAFRTLGTKEEVMQISPESLYDYYKKLIMDSTLDIFIIGNSDLDQIASFIQKYFKFNNQHHFKDKYFVQNTSRKELLICEEASPFVQSQFVALYNINGLTKMERELTFHVFNFILGSGGLSSKLYKYIREENSYCYRIASMYFKYDNLLCIASSLSKENIKHTIKLIEKALQEMQSGNFTDDDLEQAKLNLLQSLKMNEHNQSSILMNYEFKYALGNFDGEEKLRKLPSITKEDVINVAKKVQKNTYFTLCEVANEKN